MKLLLRSSSADLIAAFYCILLSALVSILSTFYLCAAFMRKDPKIIKIQSSSQYLFALLRPARVKAAHKMLMKLTP